MKPEEFKERRQKLGLTQSEIGVLMSVNARTIQHYEAGKGTIRMVNELAFEALEARAEKMKLTSLRDEYPFGSEIEITQTTQDGSIWLPATVVAITEEHIVAIKQNGVARKVLIGSNDYRKPTRT